MLPVFVGKATKACDILPDTKKIYTAGFRLGVSTDTLDITGRVIRENADKVTADRLERIRQRFVGEITQLPPMYSAVKVDGKRLYQLAREGKTVQRTPRKCIVHSIEIISYDEGTREGEMTISCEKGTYVRTIIDDMGNALGTGAVMTSLVRTYSAGFDIAQCLTMEQIEQICKQGRIGDVIMSVEKAFEMYGGIRLDRRLTELYKNGVKLYRSQLKEEQQGDFFRVFGSDGSFLGLAAFKNEMLCSVKNFY